MNPIWQDFLTSQLICNTSSNNALYSISHLSILKVSGNEAMPFLQGQLTCDVKALTENNSFFAGFCNAKGRVITTLLILKQADAFLLILPTVLLDKVKNKLQLYILRSKVQLENASNDYGLSGFTCTEEMARSLALPEIRFERNETFLKLSNSHYLIISKVAESITQWTELLKHNFHVQDFKLGQTLDLNAGLAWLDDTNSEEYIPQMLNLDKLGGISFTKGCYTGQEVVARTHYLGKAKRELFLAKVENDVTFTDDNSVMDETGQLAGKILTFQQGDDFCRLLLVMQITTNKETELRLNNLNQDKISLIPFTTV